MHTIYVTIPPGSKYLVHLQLRKASYFILPRNEDKDITGQHVNVPYSEWFEMRAAENTLTLITWNTDAKKAHRVRLLIGVLPKVVMEMPDRFVKALHLWTRMFMRRPKPVK